MNKFIKKFKQNDRRLKLDKSTQYELIKQQDNIDPLSGAPIFIGDETAIDHIKPIAIGGEDTIDNVQITHRASNQRKGAKYQPELEKLKQSQEEE